MSDMQQLQGFLDQIDALAPACLADYLPDDAPELDEGSPVLIHGTLATYRGVVVQVLNAWRVRVRYWCDVRREWRVGAVDEWRCEWYEWRG